MKRAVPEHPRCIAATARTRSAAANRRRVEIRIIWQQPIPLAEGSKESLRIYVPRNPDEIPARPGVYVFGRHHGDTVSPLYIGKAENLSRPIEQQLNNVRLMKGIENSPGGERIVLIGELSLRPGQRVARVLDV